jgi:hyaluronoglucosaminidase
VGSFEVRGIVEGFYGTPWSHAARLDAINFLAPRGMNAYVYAPKDDAKHRAEWREPYTDAERRDFKELAEHARAAGVRFGFAISPGLDIEYASPTDREVLFAKLAPLRDAGVDWFLLCVDDIPMQSGLAERQADLGTWLRLQFPDAAFTVCPTEYVGTKPSPYLAELGRGLPADVDLMWTGPTVCSPTITVDDAKGWAEAVGDHRVIVWDNYPVNDALMTKSLHLGPYRGRAAGLAAVVGGVLCNPMTQPRASLVALATAMDFLRAPDEYNEDESWPRAIGDVGGDELRPLARACADGPLSAPDHLDLARRVDALAAVIDTPACLEHVEAITDELRAARGLTETMTSGALAEECAPWVFRARVEAEAGLAALRLIRQVRPLATQRAADPESAMHHAFAVLYMWSGARADGNVVYGPRFALYTPVIQLADGAPGLDAAAAVRENANAIDALCRLALATYDRWRVERSET